VWNLARHTRAARGLTNKEKSRGLSSASEKQTSSDRHGEKGQLIKDQLTGKRTPTVERTVAGWKGNGSSRQSRGKIDAGGEGMRRKPLLKDIYLASASGGTMSSRGMYSDK